MQETTNAIPFCFEKYLDKPAKELMQKDFTGIVTLEQLFHFLQDEKQAEEFCFEKQRSKLFWGWFASAVITTHDGDYITIDSWGKNIFSAIFILCIIAQQQ